MILISVIIPVYNAEKYLKDCLDSVLNQSIKNIEIICIDDGSTDSSYNILLEYSNKYKNIIIIQQSNRGSGPARNQGIIYANGKYICFLDADDYYASNEALEYLYSAAEKNNVFISGGNFVRLLQEGDTDNTYTMFYEDKKVLFADYGNPFNYWCFLFSRKLICDNDIYFPDYRRFQDPPFFVKAMACAKEFYSVAKSIYVWRVEHKKIDFTEKIAIDVLHGIRDCFIIAEKNNFIKMYNKFLKNILFKDLKIYYKYALVEKKEIWDIIDNINYINKRWMNEQCDVCLNINTLKKYIISVEAERKKLINHCNRAEKIIIYGAGIVGKHILNNYGRECKNILGFAVSEQNPQHTYFENYHIAQINDYMDKHMDALVIVAVSKKYQDEIMNNLISLGFKNIYCLDSQKIIFAEEI